GIENISASPFANGTPKDIDYRLFSILSLTEQLSVVDYLELAQKEYNDTISAGKTPIFVGGTGFYIRAITDGISPMPEIGADARTRARDMVAHYPDAARELLKNADPEFSFTDPQRMGRALEVFLETGRALSEWQKLPKRGAIAPDACKILINPHKDILIKRIAERIPLMIDGGAMIEARAVIDANWDTGRAIGADELVRFLKGEIDIKTATKNWIIRTNQYAKRQRTWFRNQFNADVEIGHVPTNDDLELIK
ncbi:MAG: hypothetical protein FWC83_01795, partial [Alphaproteobacteria bacterium]|nr:hypothetical protein [Alphaproteobacteria bacterium]